MKRLGTYPPRTPIIRSVLYARMTSVVRLSLIVEGEMPFGLTQKGSMEFNSPKTGFAL